MVKQIPVPINPARILRGRITKKLISFIEATAPEKGSTISLETGKQAYSRRIMMNMAIKPYSEMKLVIVLI
jgi:hypothetical protein